MAKLDSFLILGMAHANYPETNSHSLGTVMSANKRRAIQLSMIDRLIHYITVIGVYVCIHLDWTMHTVAPVHRTSHVFLSYPQNTIVGRDTVIC